MTWPSTSHDSRHRSRSCKRRSGNCTTATSNFNVGTRNSKHSARKIRTTPAARQRLIQLGRNGRRVCAALRADAPAGKQGIAVRYGPGVKARVLYLQQYQLLPYQRTSEAMRDLFGCHLSAGTVANIVRECAAQLVETELKIKQRLRCAGVIHADETGLRVAKQ